MMIIPMAINLNEEKRDKKKRCEYLVLVLVVDKRVRSEDQESEKIEGKRYKIVMKNIERVKWIDLYLRMRC